MIRSFSVTALVFLFCACISQNKTKAPVSTKPQILSDSVLLDLVQKQTIKYFTDGAEPVSGMGRERFHTDDNYPENDKNIITSGGSGFGVMSLIVAMERKFISREEGLQRLEKIVHFLETADRFHGAATLVEWGNGKSKTIW